MIRMLTLFEATSATAGRIIRGKFKKKQSLEILHRSVGELLEDDKQNPGGCRPGAHLVVRVFAQPKADGRHTARDHRPAGLLVSSGDRIVFLPWGTRAKRLLADTETRRGG